MKPWLHSPSRITLACCPSLPEVEVDQKFRVILSYRELTNALELSLQMGFLPPVVMIFLGIKNFIEYCRILVWIGTLPNLKTRPTTCLPQTPVCKFYSTSPIIPIASNKNKAQILICFRIPTIFSLPILQLST